MEGAIARLVFAREYIGVQVLHLHIFFADGSNALVFV